MSKSAISRISLVTACGCFALLLAPPLAAKDAKDVIMPQDTQTLAIHNQFGFADAVIAGDMVYLSGVIAAPGPSETNLVPAYERAFKRLSKILKRAGVSWDDVVDMTSYHTDLGAQVKDMSEVKNRYIKAPFPAWTAIGISALFEPTGVTEIKIVARRVKTDTKTKASAKKDK